MATTFKTWIIDNDATGDAEVRRQRSDMLKLRVAKLRLKLLIAKIQIGAPDVPMAIEDDVEDDAIAILQ
jgi:hypothetical protein